MLDFVAEFLAELVVAPLMSWVLALAYGLARTAVWLALYPWLLLLGWGWLGLRARGRMGWLGVWQVHGPQGLHRAGGQQARRAVQGLLAALLLGLAAAGVGAVLYGLAQHVGL